jgi:hypothetical protein
VFPLSNDRTLKEAAAMLMVTFAEHVREEHPEDISRWPPAKKRAGRQLPGA